MKEKKKFVFLEKKEFYLNPWVNYTPKKVKKPSGYDLK